MNPNFVENNISFFVPLNPNVLTSSWTLDNLVFPCKAYRDLNEALKESFTIAEVQLIWYDPSPPHALELKSKENITLKSVIKYTKTILQ